MVLILTLSALGAFLSDKGFGNGNRDKGAKVLQGMMKKAERSV